MRWMFLTLILTFGCARGERDVERLNHTAAKDIADRLIDEISIHNIGFKYDRRFLGCLRHGCRVDRSP